MFFSSRKPAGTVTDPAALAGKSFDYVVVGGGTAGCVLASRLSEIPDVSVLLVEAGGSHEDEPLSKMPIRYPQLLGSGRDWCYKTVPQAACNNREIPFPRGKMLGGSSSINASVYQHCSPSDWDEWEKMGATGWGYSSIAPYFRKAEKFTPHPDYPIDLDARGTDGPVQTGYMYTHPICDAWVKAAHEVGVPFVEDINTPRGPLGATKFITSCDPQGQRSSPATAYLSQDVTRRPNLTVLLNTITTRLLLSSDEQLRATGIEITKGEGAPVYEVFARKEVILSAGVAGSPHILMLSGIGPKEQLENFGISVKKDLKHVGENLLDHPLVFLTCRAAPGTTLAYMKNPLKGLFLQWHLFGTGPMTSNAGEAALFARTDDPKPSLGPSSEPIIDNTTGPDAPDIEVGIVPSAVGVPQGSEAIIMAAIVPRPLSSGRITLASASPFAAPLIDPRYLSHPNDIRVMVRAVRLALRIARAATLQPLLQRGPVAPGSRFWPGDAEPDAVGDAELEAWIRDNLGSVNHGAGTARIAPHAGADVVDPTLRVFGVAGLRVVDASVFPSMLSGHPAAPVIAIAEKAADMIVHGE